MTTCASTEAFFLRSLSTKKQCWAQTCGQQKKVKGATGCERETAFKEVQRRGGLIDWVSEWVNEWMSGGGSVAAAGRWGGERARGKKKKKKAPLCSGDMWATGCDRMDHRSLSHSHALTEIVITRIKCHSNKRKPAERVKSGVFIYFSFYSLTPRRQVGGACWQL